MKLYPTNDKNINEYLEKAADEYKEMLFKELIRRSDLSEKYSVSELASIDHEIKKQFYYDHQRQNRMIKLFNFAIIYLVAAFIIVLFIFLLDGKWNTGKDSPFAIISVTLGFLGAVTGLWSILSSVKLAKKKTDPRKDIDQMPMLQYETIGKWREIEGLAKDISTDNRQAKSPSSALSILYENNYVNPDEYKVLKEFLRMRNEILHRPTNALYDEEKIKNLLKQVNPILEKLKQYT